MSRAHWSSSSNLKYQVLWRLVTNDHHDEPTLFPMLTESNDLRGEFNINDDNEPAPKNVPKAATLEFLLYNEWGHNGICFCKQSTCINNKARLIFPIDPTADDMYIHLFIGLFPREWLIDLLLSDTNEVIVGEPLLLREFSSVD